ncbi:OLC1v1010945C1 [Oldenlandia corymbosa var. corymbosa]|uniref:OLC1v1010945C1 n=1 Tax=Oldenlandia corymbosa var. corymbosa TaxID=529605 RepID=A0AAV1DSJ5_OLDCO|nr:OLC1v1010945C1 [Oldenlandia corymbosa var. corymbosa]
MATSCSLSSVSLVLIQPHNGLLMKLPRRWFSRNMLKTSASAFHTYNVLCRRPLSESKRRCLTNFSVGSVGNLSQMASSQKPDAPGLHHFMPKATVASSEPQMIDPIATSEVLPKGRIYQETYGCQMNVNDMEIVLSIMKKAGYSEVVDVPESAEIIFINTCAIRDNAEQKVWQRLNYFWFLKRHWKSNVKIGRSQSLHPPKVVVLGCMAERLKDKILDADKMVDVVCGPDAYRDLPRLLEEVDSGQKGINTLLSLEETYADISPVRVSKDSISAFVSIMRGCNNMCSFCIVPFTRGRERSRPVESIVREVGELWNEGVKEVTLLGQNVNSYNDTSGIEKEVEPGSNWKLSEGFSSRCKVKNMGLRFADLLDRLAVEYPEMRFRFTSPHPKDFPDELLYVMRDRHNICKSIHLPAQTGSSTVLERMRRGYTREAYLELVTKIRSTIPDMGISSDFICGFCGETEEEHQDTLSLVKTVGYDMAYMFAYSMREKTHAHRTYVDDVPEDVKQRRLAELIEAFRESTGQCFDSQVGTVQLVLVEGPNKRAPDTELIGKSDRGHRVSFRNLPLPDMVDNAGKRNPKVGDFVEVRITKSSRASLSGEALAITKLSSFYGILQENTAVCAGSI